MMQRGSIVNVVDRQLSLNVINFEQNYFEVIIIIFINSSCYFVTIKVAIVGFMVTAFGLPIIIVDSFGVNYLSFMVVVDPSFLISV